VLKVDKLIPIEYARKIQQKKEDKAMLTTENVNTILLKAVDAEVFIDNDDTEFSSVLRDNVGEDDLRDKVLAISMERRETRA
jgi:hypothetical protein